MLVLGSAHWSTNIYHNGHWAFRRYLRRWPSYRSDEYDARVDNHSHLYCIYYKQKSFLLQRGCFLFISLSHIRTKHSRVRDHTCMLYIQPSTTTTARTHCIHTYTVYWDIVLPKNVFPYHNRININIECECCWASIDDSHSIQYRIYIQPWHTISNNNNNKYRYGVKWNEIKYTSAQSSSTSNSCRRSRRSHSRRQKK